MAMAWPIPRVPPVINAVLPVSEKKSIMWFVCVGFTGMSAIFYIPRARVPRAPHATPHIRGGSVGVIELMKRNGLVAEGSNKISETIDHSCPGAHNFQG
jgi:hypothetical protein